MSISEKKTYLKHNSHIQQKVNVHKYHKWYLGIKNDGETERITIKDSF